LRGESLDFTEITKGLGTEWEILNVRPKLYPCCHYLQSFLDCMSSLRKQHRLRPEEVAQIDCRVAQGAVNIVCEPWEKKLSPKTGYDGRFSLPFAVSLMLSKGRAGVEEFSERYLEDVEIKELMRRVRYEVEPSFEVKDMPGWIILRLRNGEKVEHRIDQVRGDALHPIQREELFEKFQRNAVSLGREKGQRTAEQILGFEALRGVGDLMKELSLSGQE
jgi:2-methylcitrate dehydratase PrpD